MDREKTARLNVVLSMFIYGTIGLFVRYIPLPSSVIALARGVIGSLFLVLVLLFRRTWLSWAAIRAVLPRLCATGAMLGELFIWREGDIWAPELHFLFGKWYIYFAASREEDIWRLRPYILECTGDDPMKDEWVEKGMMKRSDDDIYSFEAFSLDATIFENKGEYLIIKR